MLRYLALAAIVVLGVTVAVTAWARRDALRLKIASVYASVPPKAEPSDAPAAAKIRPLRGDAPWALSALPECALQLSRTTGPLAYVRAHLPPGATEVFAPAILHVGECVLSLHDSEIDVRRGSDLLRIPPPAHLYRSPGRLAVLRKGGGGADLRVYEPTSRLNL